MTIEYLNTPGVPEPQGFTHVSIATGERIIHVAGQVGQDENVTLIGVQSLFGPDMLVEIEGVAIR
jgi:enamine deaminase RidA (YjgF/YER057c/UK114 family)